MRDNRNTWPDPAFDLADAPTRWRTQIDPTEHFGQPEPTPGNPLVTAAHREPAGGRLRAWRLDVTNCRQPWLSPTGLVRASLAGCTGRYRAVAAIAAGPPPQDPLDALIVEAFQTQARQHLRWLRQSPLLPVPGGLSCQPCRRAAVAATAGRDRRGARPGWLERLRADQLLVRPGTTQRPVTPPPACRALPEPWPDLGCATLLTQTARSARALPGEAHRYSCSYRPTTLWDAPLPLRGSTFDGRDPAARPARPGAGQAQRTAVRLLSGSGRRSPMIR